MQQWLTIGQIARAPVVTTTTIRYYEEVGMLPALRRSEAGYRHQPRPQCRGHERRLVVPAMWEVQRPHGKGPADLATEFHAVVDHSLWADY